jgi:hypothetical protein
VQRAPARSLSPDAAARDAGSARTRATPKASIAVVRQGWAPDQIRASHWRKLCLSLRPCAVCYALLRAGIREWEGGMTPLPLLAQQWLAISALTAGACRSGLNAKAATGNRMLVPHRLGQSHRHVNDKQRYRESPQHGLFLP